MSADPKVEDVTRADGSEVTREALATAAQGSETKGATAPLESERELLIQPLPWTAAETADMWGAYDPNGFCVLHGVLEDEARFIVTAVNSHHDLLAALKALRKECDPLFWAGLPLIMQVDAAIQKAEGHVS